MPGLESRSFTSVHRLAPLSDRSTMSIFDNVVAGLRLTRRKGVDLEERAEQSLRGAGL